MELPVAVMAHGSHPACLSFTTPGAQTGVNQVSVGSFSPGHPESGKWSWDRSQPRYSVQKSKPTARKVGTGGFGRGCRLGNIVSGDLEEAPVQQGFVAARLHLRRLDGALLPTHGNREV